jgi:adenosylhomocysteine nucleosidase
MKTIGMVAATRQESLALLHLLKDYRKIRLGSFQVYRFQLPLWDCVLVESGMGIARAEQATRVLIEKFHPTMLVSFGIAGAVDDDLQIGDVIAAGSNALLYNGKLEQIQKLASLTKAAREAVSNALNSKGAGLYRGTAITTRGSQFIKQQHEPLEYPVLEMETFGILQGIAGKQIPLLVLRAISDGPRSPIPFNLEAVVDENYNMRIGKILLAILKRPAILQQVMQMSRNANLAAHNAADAVVAALGSPMPIEVSK